MYKQMDPSSELKFQFLPQQYIGENDVFHLLGVGIDEAEGFCSQPHPLLLLAEEAILNCWHRSAIFHSWNKQQQHTSIMYLVYYMLYTILHSILRTCNM